MWSWILAAIGVTGIFLVGRKTIWGWLILCINECLWIAYAFATKQYGFIAMALAYAAVYIKSFIHWRNEDLIIDSKVRLNKKYAKIFTMSSILSWKRISWGYYKNLKNNGDEIELSGFRHNGSIITDRAIEYDKYLHLKFKVFIYSNPHEGAALLDIDFWDKNKSHVSIVLNENKTNLAVKDGSIIYGILSMNNLSGWQDFDIYLDHKKVQVTFGNNVCIHKFKRKKKSCTIAFGNNVMPELEGTEQPPTFAVKEIMAETENGSFPLIINNLINIDSMVVWGGTGKRSKHSRRA